MNTVEIEATKLTVPDLAALAKNGPVILTCKGEPIASVKDLSGRDWESVALANNARFQALIEESRRSYREEGGLSLAAVRQELGLTPRRRPRAGKKKKPATKKP